MEIYYLVLCCVLFATTVSFSSLGAVQEYEIDSLVQDAQVRDCKCENGKCVTNKQGNTKCVCKPGYALQDEMTCKPCDCGSLGKCLFILKLTKSRNKPEYQKKCVCDQGSAEKDGACVNCFCGENSACDFDYGEKRCYCLDGFSEKDGVCTKCNCGDHGTCSFQSGQKTCRCQPGYRENNGICERCDCGSNSESCEFINGVKRCNCKDRYADRYGTCEACYCGTSSRDCSFTDNQKTCSCLEGYVQKGETCELGCSARHPCQNGGHCKEGFCFCQSGTRGEFCDAIDGCPDLCPQNQTDVKCSYDVASRRAYCRCLDNSRKFDHRQQECRRTCEKEDECGVKGMCIDDFCRCFPPVRGDRCEILDCLSGVIKCSRQMHLLWWGGDTLFLVEGRNVRRFQRQDGEAANDCDATGIACEHNFYITWNGGDTLCVPWQQRLIMQFKLQETNLASRWRNRA